MKVLAAIREHSPSWLASLKRSRVENQQDMQRIVPLDYTGDGNLPPRVLDMSATPVSSGARGMMGMPLGVPAATTEQDVGDQIKSDITVGGKKNKTHYGKKFGKKHKSAMLDFTKSLWMQDAAASLKNVLKSEVRNSRLQDLTIDAITLQQLCEC